jgi:hypothetical protein
VITRVLGQEGARAGARLARDTLPGVVIRALSTEPNLPFAIPGRPLALLIE